MPPIISAMSWCIADGKSGQVLWGKLENEVREMASLTKMMTFLVTLQFLDRLELDQKKIFFKVKLKIFNSGKLDI